MPKAMWSQKVLAVSDQTEVVEGNQYFPPGSITREFFVESDYQTICPWKGTASYYHIEVNGKLNENAAWYYPNPKDAAKQIKDHVAFWKGVDVEE